MGAALFDDPVVAAPSGKALFDDPPTEAAQPKAAPPGGAVSDFLGGVGSKLNPLNMLQGMADTVKAGYEHPIDTALSVLAHPYSALKRAKEAMDAGKPEEAAAHIESALSPAGFVTEDSAVKTATPGKRAEGFGELVGTGIATLLGAKLPEAAPTAGKVVTAAAKAGGGDVAVGAIKTAAGVALAKSGPLGEVGDVIAGVPIVKSGVQQMGRGARAAFQAGREAYNARVVEPAAAPPPLPAAATTAPEAAPAVSPTPTAPPPTDPEFLDNAAFYRAADTRRAATEAPAAAPLTSPPALARAAAPTTTQAKTITADVGAALPEPPPEAAPPANPAPTPPPPAAPAAPAAAPIDIRDRIAQDLEFKNFAAVKDPKVAATVQRLADQQIAREGATPSAPAAFTDTETTGLQIPRVVNARAAVVNNMADYFHQGGLKAADLVARRSQPAAWDLLWKNAAKKSGSKQGAAYTPSADTISATIERLESLEKTKAAESDIEDQLIRSLKAARGKNAKVSDLMR